MAGTLGRLRFYLWCGLSDLEVDYAPPLGDYPEYPREEGVEIFKDTYKSALGSNYWTYFRGTAGYWNMNFVEVSDDCAATFSIMVGSSMGLYPHIAIWEGQGLDGISLGSLQTITDSRLKGTFFADIDGWSPREIRYGLWNFEVLFRREN